MARITLDHASKRYGATVAVDDFSLDIAHGSFLAVLGPSGCGKSTVLRLIAGFERVSAGTVAIDGRTVSGPGVHVPAERRRIGIVFQSYALWPHMTVEANVGYPLRVARVTGTSYRERVDQALRTVGLAGLGARKPSELSGGQRQRVALARCLVMEPALVLLDEPLANLDVHLRAAMEDEFRAFHRKTGATMVYVTHDQSEAMALAHEIAVMDKGRLVQLADPHALYREPRTAMVAGFIGRSALVEAEVVARTGPGTCEVVVLGARATVRCSDAQTTGVARVCLRPEDLALAAEGRPARVHRVTYKGGFSEIEIVPDGATEALLLTVAQAPAPGSSVRFAVLGGWVVPSP